MPMRKAIKRELTMTKAGKIAITLSTIAVLVCAGSAFATDDKFDGDCTGDEWAGRCIDKPEPTGCPYGDSIPVDSPKCVPPAEPAQEAPATTTNPVPDTELPEFKGK